MGRGARQERPPGGSRPPPREGPGSALDPGRGAAERAGEAGTKKARRCRPLPLREKLYRRVLELRAEGLSYSQIVERVYEEFGEKLSKSEVSYWCRGVHRPGGNVRYDLRPSRDLGWLLGAAIGDGNVSFRRGSTYYTIEIKGRRELVEVFAEAVSKAFGRDPPPVRPAERDLVSACFRCARLYYLLADFGALVEFVESDKEVKRGFLGGLGDAEAHVAEDGTVRVYNSDLELLRRAQRWFGDFGIEATGPHLSTRKGTKFRDARTSREHERSKDVFYIYVRTRSLETFYREIGFRIPRKQKRLDEAIKRRKRRKRG